MPVTRYLVETSLVRAALGQTTSAHYQHFQQEAADGELVTSAYVRMEFIRVWVCGAFEVAFVLAHFPSTADALVYLEQEFQQRKNKMVLAVLAAYLREAAPTNGQLAAEDLVSLGGRLLEQFDAVLCARTPNACGCQRGIRELILDFNNLLASAGAFYRQFGTPVTDYALNAFLRLGDVDSPAAPLLNREDLAELTAVANLGRVAERRTHITCTECARIGDAVIALDQPADCTLLHLDAVFDQLCAALGRQHKKLRSVRAVEGPVLPPGSEAET